jgi:hypothetical protein
MQRSARLFIQRTFLSDHDFEILLLYLFHCLMNDTETPFRPQQQYGLDIEVEDRTLGLGGRLDSSKDDLVLDASNNGETWNLQSEIKHPRPNCDYRFSR